MHSCHSSCSLAKRSSIRLTPSIRSCRSLAANGSLPSPSSRARSRTRSGATCCSSSTRLPRSKAGRWTARITAGSSSSSRTCCATGATCLSASLRGLLQMLTPEQLGDLHGVESCALAQIVADHPEAETVLDRRVFADAADVGRIFADGLDRSHVAAVLALIDDHHAGRL